MPKIWKCTSCAMSITRPHLIYRDGRVLIVCVACKEAHRRRIDELLSKKESMAMAIARMDQALQRLGHQSEALLKHMEEEFIPAMTKKEAADV